MELIMNRGIVNVNEHGGKRKIHCDNSRRKSYDVFFARGHKFDSYPGNKLYRKVVRLYSRLYRQSSDLKEKKAYADNVIASIRSKRGRFFHQTKRNKDTYQELDPCGNELRDKVRQALRDTGEKAFHKEEEEVVKVVVVAIDHRNNSTKQKQLGNDLRSLSDMGGFSNNDYRNCHVSRTNHDFNCGNSRTQEESNEETPSITLCQDQHLNTHTIPNIILTNSSIINEYSTQYLQFQHRSRRHQQFQFSRSQPGTRSDAAPFMTVDVDKEGDVKRMQNSSQDNRVETQQILSSNQSFTTTNTNKEVYDCQENHHNHQYKNTSNHSIPIKQISDDENDVSKIFHQMEVDEVYNNENLTHLQDATNDGESINQKNIMSNMGYDLQASSQMVSSHKEHIVAPHSNKLRGYLEQISDKQFRPIHDAVDEDEQLRPEAELELIESQPRHELPPQIESTSVIDQNDDNQLTNSEMDEIINRPLFSPDLSVSSMSSDWSMSGMPDLAINW